MIQLVFLLVLAFSTYQTASTPLPQKTTISTNAAADVRTVPHPQIPTALTLNVIRIDSTTVLEAPEGREEDQNDDCNTMSGMASSSSPNSLRTETITLYTTVLGENQSPASSTQSPLHTKNSRKLTHSHHSKASAQTSLYRGPTFTTFPIVFTGLSQLADASTSVTSKPKRRKTTRTVTQTTTRTVIHTEHRPKSRTHGTTSSSSPSSRPVSKSTGAAPDSSTRPPRSPIPAPTAVPTAASYTAIPLTSTPAWVEPEPSTTTGLTTAIQSSATVQPSTTATSSPSYTSIPYVLRTSTSRTRKTPGASQSTMPPRHRASSRPIPNSTSGQPTSVSTSTSSSRSVPTSASHSSLYPSSSNAPPSSSMESLTTSSRSISSSASPSSSYHSSSSSTSSSASLTSITPTVTTQAFSNSKEKKTSHSPVVSSSSFVGDKIVPVSSNEAMKIATLLVTTTMTTLGLTATGTATITMGA